MRIPLKILYVCILYISTVLILSAPIFFLSIFLSIYLFIVLSIFFFFLSYFRHPLCTFSVLAAHWDEEPNDRESITPMTIALQVKTERRAALFKLKQAQALAAGLPPPVPYEKERTNNGEEYSSSMQGNSAKQRKSLKMVREHINLCKARMRNDPRPIDSTCGCYTCKGFSRAYLHHLFKAKETLGGTLVSSFLYVLHLFEMPFHLLEIDAVRTVRPLSSSLKKLFVS